MATNSSTQEFIDALGEQDKKSLILQFIKEYVDPKFMPMLDKDNPAMKMHVSASGAAAQMQVIDDETGHLVAEMSWMKGTQEFALMINERTTGVLKSSFVINANGETYISGSKAMTGKLTEKMIREFRTTIAMDTGGTTPTKDECITAFKRLPHFDWAVDDDFYIKSVNRDKLGLIKYRAEGATDEASAGDFWYEKLTKAH